jgi:hypothetical protein
MANATWNPADLINVVLSGTNNLTASKTVANNNNGAVRTDIRNSSGKYYFEYTCTTWGFGVAVGVANQACTLSTVGPNQINAAALQFNGAVSVNSTNPGVSFGTRANGDIVSVALDLDHLEIWFRIAPAGNWNNSGTANPATNAGGVSLAAIGTPLYGLYDHQGITSTITANFGDSAFSGTVPVGFAAGFPTPSISKRYFVETLDGRIATVTAPQASGSLVHYVDAGPTLGRLRQYSGFVTGTVSYFVDDGPTLGEERSAT